MKKPTNKEIQSALNQLVGINFLKENKGKYQYHPNYKKFLLTCKGKSVEEILIDALYKSNYFVIARTEREISIIIQLLNLKK